MDGKRLKTGMYYLRTKPPLTLLFTVDKDVIKKDEFKKK